MDEVVGSGVEHFNHRRYFEAHEVWEGRLQESEDVRERKFLEAMIQVAAALHLRFQRGGGRGTRNLFFQALVALEDFRPAFGGIDMERFHDELSEYAERVVEQKGKPAGWIDRFLAPRLHRRSTP